MTRGGRGRWDGFVMTSSDIIELCEYAGLTVVLVRVHNDSVSFQYQFMISIAAVALSRGIRTPEHMI